MTDRALWFAVPEGVGDPERVSGGNVFDLRVADGLRRLGWDVHLVEIGEAASSPAALASVPTGGLVLMDGLVGIRAPDAIEAVRGRVRLALLVHMVAGAFADADADLLAAERRVLACAGLVLTTSAWTRDELVSRGLVAPERVAVAPPGTDAAPLAEGTASGGSLLCVGVVAPHKGQDVLIDALAALGSGWTCTLVGSAAVDPGFARRVASRAAELGVGDRIRWAGAVGRRELDALYDGADVLVAPSRTESYGMAVADALRRGIPVIATRVGGIPEAVGPGRAAILVPPGRPAALRDALRRWMADPVLRDALTAAARREGPGRATWDDTAVRVTRVLGRLR